jgi:hypothetical protein
VSPSLAVRSSLQRIGAALFMIGLLSACGANAEPVFPTVRPTATISPTPAPTSTVPVTVTPTLIPATALPLPTLGATSSRPVSTALIGATSVRPAPATATSTKRAVQAGSLVIEFFTTTAQSVRPGEKLTLFWSVRGADNAIIYRLKPDGSKDFTWQVAQAGSLVVTTRKEDKDVTRFVLTIGDNITRIEQSLSVPLKCAADIWFFQPAPDACPAGPATVTQAAAQGFERGQMIWLSGQGRIYVLFNDGKKPAWESFADDFKDGMPDRDGSLNPPSGLSQPIRGFGLVWRTQSKVRDRLGWATGAEQPYESTLQSDSVSQPDTTLYVRSKDQAIYALSGNGASWKLIAPTP